MAPDPRFLDGIGQFNRQDFYAAHDAWESLWLERFGEEKEFLQGLILCAVALHHYERRNFNGARSRFRLARGKLESYPATFWGLNLKNFLRRMNGALHRLLTEEVPPPLDLKAVPALKLKS
jgi:predicted metal-dependent hydrolase